MMEWHPGCSWDMMRVSTVFKLYQCAQSLASWNKLINSNICLNCAAKSAFALTLKSQIHFQQSAWLPQENQHSIEQCCCEKPPHILTISQRISIVLVTLSGIIMISTLTRTSTKLIQYTLNPCA